MPVVQFEIKGTVGYIMLNRPEKMNAFNREMALELQEKLDECAADRAVRAVYITGAGKAFSAGQDLVEAADPAKLKQILSEQFNPIVKKITALEKPVIAAVNGIAAGAGANIALCCDIIVAAESASFIQAFSKIGLIPDSGGTYTLPRLIGWQKASAIMMLGDKIPAAEAERLGMIYKVLPDESFMTDSIKMAMILSQMPTRGLALTKKALQLSVSNNLEQQLNAEDELQTSAGATFDFSEGVRAFMEKRPPEFKGE